MPEHRETPALKAPDYDITAAILQSSPIAAFAVNTDHKVVYWNKALESLTGYKAAEMIGSGDHWKIFYPEKRELMADLLIEGKAEMAGASQSQQAQQ
ncbi:MAG: PAS domain-containing protein, partial [Syntrophaceae bacterium]